MTAGKQKAYRDRLRGGPPRAPQPCGTYAAARRHQRQEEPVCEACRAALQEYTRTHRRNP